MPNSYSRRNRSNNSTFAPLSKPPLAPAPQVEGRLVTPGGVGQHSPAHGGHHSIAKPAARQRPGRYGFRDATMVLVTYLHGLRVSEVCALRWDQLEFGRGELHVS